MGWGKGWEKMTRKRSPHPGIVVRPGRPAKGEKPHIRFLDPDTGRPKTKAIPEGLAGDELDRWLIKRSAELMLRKVETDPSPGESISITAARRLYVQEMHRLKESTLEQYGYTLNKLEAWCAENKLTNLNQLTRQWLRKFRRHLDEPGRAAASVNRDLTAASAFLRHCCKEGRLSLTLEDFTFGLERLDDDFEKKDPLKPEQIRALVQSLEPGPFEDYVLGVLLTGLRRSEALQLAPEDVVGDAIMLPASKSKTGQARRIDLSVSPTLLVNDKLSKSIPYGLTEDALRYQREASSKQLGFKWGPQILRVTCGTYLTCAPGIYGGASAYMSAKRLGHSVAIAEKHYVGMVNIDPAAKTLEQALGIEDLLKKRRPK